MRQGIRITFASLLFCANAFGCQAARPLPAAAASSSAREEAPFCSRWISGQEAIARVANGATLLDVRTPAEFREDHLDGATHIPVDELEARMDELPAQEHVIVYCASGRRAHRAALLFAERGRSVSELGHMNQYRVGAPAGCTN